MNLVLENDPRPVIVDDEFYANLSQHTWYRSTTGILQTRKSRFDLWHRVGKLTQIPTDDTYGPKDGNWFDARAVNVAPMSRHDLPPLSPPPPPPPPVKSDSQTASEKPTPHPEAIGPWSSADVIRLHRKMKGQK